MSPVSLCQNAGEKLLLGYRRLLRLLDDREEERPSLLRLLLPDERYEGELLRVGCDLTRLPLFDDRVRAGAL